MWRQIAWRILLKSTLRFSGPAVGSRTLFPTSPQLTPVPLVGGPHSEWWVWHQGLRSPPPTSKAMVTQDFVKKEQTVKNGSHIKTYSSVGQFQGPFPVSNLCISLRRPEKITGAWWVQRPLKRQENTSESRAKTDCNKHRARGQFNQMITWYNVGKSLNMITWFYLKPKENEFVELLSTHSDTENTNHYGDSLCIWVPAAGFPEFCCQ